MKVNLAVGLKACVMATLGIKLAHEREAEMVNMFCLIIKCNKNYFFS
jgi:hypothetical protein